MRALLYAGSRLISFKLITIPEAMSKNIVRAEKARIVAIVYSPLVLTV